MASWNQHPHGKSLLSLAALGWLTACGTATPPGPAKSPSPATLVCESIEDLEKAESRLSEFGIQFETTYRAAPTAIEVGVNTTVPLRWITWGTILPEETQVLLQAASSLADFSRCSAAISERTPLAVPSTKLEWKQKESEALRMQTLLRRRLIVHRICEKEQELREFGIDVPNLPRGHFTSAREFSDPRTIPLRSSQVVIATAHLERLLDVLQELTPDNTVDVFSSWATHRRREAFDARQFLKERAEGTFARWFLQRDELSELGITLTAPADFLSLESPSDYEITFHDEKTGITSRVFSPANVSRHAELEIALDRYINDCSALLRQYQRSWYARELVLLARGYRASAIRAKRHLVFRRLENRALASLDSLSGEGIHFPKPTRDAKADVIHPSRDAVIRDRQRHSRIAGTLLYLRHDLRTLANSEGEERGLRYSLAQGSRVIESDLAGVDHLVEFYGIPMEGF